MLSGSLRTRIKKLEDAVRIGERTVTEIIIRSMGDRPLEGLNVKSAGWKYEARAIGEGEESFIERVKNEGRVNGYTGLLLMIESCDTP